VFADKKIAASLPTFLLYRLNPMKDTQSLPMVDVTALQVGMYVYLELGWMAHPFPLSHFKIATLDQIKTIQGLGLKQVRWCSVQSGSDHSTQLPGLPSTPNVFSASGSKDVSAPTPPDAADPASAAPQQKKIDLAAQRASLALCEKQFTKAARECRRMNESLATSSKTAGEQALALSRALLDKMAGAQEVLIRLLSDAAGDKSSAHAVSVGLLSLLLGRALGWSDADLMDLGVGALTHDIGKLKIHERVRARQDHFPPADLAHYQDHVAHGVQVGRSMGLSAAALTVIAQHHETMDGGGFPSRSAGDRLSLAARLVAIVNRYDNLCNPHMPAHALTPHEALALMYAQGQAKFDTGMLNAFIKMMGVYPPGSLVQLSDERFAMVVSVNSSRPLKPCVLAYERNVPRHEALMVDLQQWGDVSIRRSLNPLGLPPEALIYLSPRQRVAYFFEPLRALDSVDAALKEAA
jgi:putative nucleotidyltransferase with HDIG domain